MNEYVVTISYTAVARYRRYSRSSSYQVLVTAENRREAIKKAKGAFDCVCPVHGRVRILYDDINVVLSSS